MVSEFDFASSGSGKSPAHTAHHQATMHDVVATQHQISQRCRYKGNYLARISICARAVCAFCSGLYMSSATDGGTVKRPDAIARAI